MFYFVLFVLFCFIRFISFISFIRFISSYFVLFRFISFYPFHPFHFIHFYSNYLFYSWSKKIFSWSIWQIIPIKDICRNWLFAEMVTTIIIFTAANWYGCRKHIWLLQINTVAANNCTISKNLVHADHKKIFSRLIWLIILMTIIILWDSRKGLT